MPKCTDARIDFGRLGRRVIEADFSGGDLSSDGGVLLLRQVDEYLGLSRAAAAAIPDPRDPERVRHSLRDLLAQRLYGLCCGYEDLNDHKALRGDVLMQTAVGRDEALASAPTFSRLENRATRAQAWALHEVLAAQLIASFDKQPAQLVLDIDASDVPLHGQQELSQFHAYYDHHCYLPLYVFCGQAMLACVLRPSKIDGAKHAAAVIKLIVTRLRQAWPGTRFIVRADSGFCRRRLLQWCERSDVGYIVGLARNARLHAAVEVAEAALADAYEASGSKQRLIGEFSYAAKSWNHERRVITRLEYGDQGTNPRFVVTNLEGEPGVLYEGLYCQRGEAENRIKEAQVGLFATRTSCHVFASNQLRVLLAALAYVLIERMRALALQGTDLATAQIDTLRIKLLKLAAVVTRNTRRIRLYFASNWPSAPIFVQAMRALGAA